jgi:microcystin-dependent protein
MRKPNGPDDLFRWATQTDFREVPTGAVILFAATPEREWIRADGRQLNKVAYAGLFATIGTGYNVGGEPVSMFRVPNMTNLGGLSRYIRS